MLDRVTDSESYFATLVAEASDAIISIDPDGRINLFNHEAESMFGLTADYAVGQPLTNFMPGAYAQGHHHLVEQFLTEGASRRRMGDHMEVEAQRADGSRFPVEVAIAKTEVAGQTVMTAVIRDITQRRHEEQQLERALQAALDAQQELETVARELDHRNQELEEFVYVASHDLQEPLRMVASFTELLRKRYSGQLDDDAHEFIDFAVDGARRMQALIDSLLQYSRTGRTILEPARLSLSEVVADATRDLGIAIQENAAVVDCGHLPPVRGDADMLRRLFQNLIGNALKYRAVTPPRISISAQPAQPTDDYPDDAWHFQVSDNGIGFEPDHADRIFRVFQRLHGTGEYAGTGIGLAICKKIVTRHGGRIWATGRPGHGATFHFTLPDLLGETDAPTA